jgi:soluble lytic murein transglycosylase-like protein
MPTKHRRAAVALALLLATAAEARAQCQAAAAMAERRHGIPAGLLQAISQVETGRRPWALNAAGEPRLHPTRDAAVADLRRLLAQGVRPLDVGCLQVSLFHHPGAFASPEEALDPVTNADYAARFLRDLFMRTGNWRDAVARYHSADRERGSRYLAAVEGVSLPVAYAARPSFTPAEARARALAALEARLAALGRRPLARSGTSPQAAPLPPLIERL